MIRYGKTTQNAIAAMSRLAQDYGHRLSSQDIAEDRGLSQTMTAKILTTLSQSGLVTGAPGPNGGYTLARNPAEISLLDIAAVFEDPDRQTACPFGPNWCGNHKKCPLHDRLTTLDEHIKSVLSETCLDIFSVESFD